MYRSIILSALLAISAGLHAQHQSSPAAQGPIITFAQLEHDYGTIAQGANGNCEFVCTNTGDQPLIISQCQSSCGCMVPRCPSEPIAPGKSAMVHVKYDTNRQGPFTKTVTVQSNAANAPVVVLRIKGKVLPQPAESAPAKTTSPQDH